MPATGLFKSNAAFFRRGTSGAGREVLSDRELAAYHARAARLAPADLLAWLHSPRREPGAQETRRPPRAHRPSQVSCSGYPAGGQVHR